MRWGKVRWGEVGWGDVETSDVCSYTAHKTPTLADVHGHFYMFHTSS